MFCIRQVIDSRRDEMENTLKQKQLVVGDLASDEVSLFTRKRYAFLDSLLLAHLQNPNEFTMKDIHDEVSTFMFAGHDTSSINLIFTSLMIASDQRVQVKFIYFKVIFFHEKYFLFIRTSCMKNWNPFLVLKWIDLLPPMTVVK